MEGERSHQPSPSRLFQRYRKGTLLSMQKVYVQDIFAREEAELKELGHCEDTAVYICGSLPMGKSIIDLLTHALGAEKVKAMEESGRIVKELW